MSRTLEPDERPLTLAGMDPYARLAVAVVRTAVLDAKYGKLDAARWLASEGALPFLEVVGIEQGRVIDWINEHFKAGMVQ